MEVHSDERDAPGMIDGYVRVSKVGGRDKVDGGRKFIAPELQEQKIRAWAEMKGFRVDCVHVELDAAGNDANRPKFQEALGRVEAGAVQGIAVASLDRFGRSVAQALAAIERIQGAGGTFASVDEGFDLTTDAGRLVLKIMLSLAEFELDRVRGRFADARQRAVVQQGIHISPVPPVGYQRGQDRRLVPDDEVATLIRELFERRARGEAWASLARFMESQGVRRPYDNVRARNPKWNQRSVKWVIDNPVYKGQARHGEFVKEDAHPPLIDKATWAQAQRKGRAVSPARAEAKLLTGLLRCAGCRYAMRAYRAPPKKGQALGDWTWACHRSHELGRCPAPSAIRNDRVQPIVEQRFFALLGSLRMEARTDEGDLREAQSELKDAQYELRSFRDEPKIIAALGLSAFAEGLQVRQDRVDELSAQLEDRQAAMTVRNDLNNASLEALWPTFSVEERRTALQLAIEAVFVRRGRQPLERILVVPVGRDVEVPRRGVRVERLLDPVDWEPPGAGMPNGQQPSTVSLNGIPG